MFEGMNRKKKFIVCAVVAAVLIVAVIAYSVSGKERVRSYQVISIDEERVYDDILYLTSFENRLSGTENEDITAEYIYKQFLDAGLSGVKIEEYEATLYEVNHASMSLVIYRFFNQFPEVKEYEHLEDFVLQSYSGSTDGEVSFEIVDVGDGSNESYEGKDVDGKAVIVTNDGGISYTQLMLNAWNHGAGVNIIHNVVINEEFDYRPINVGAYASADDGHGAPLPDVYPECRIPSVMVSKRVGDEIKEAINTLNPLGRAEIRINFDVTIEKRTFNVVLGEVKGKSRDYIMIGGHHDSTYPSPGASDNGAGTVTVIGIARALADFKTEKTIKFATWGGEEEGLLGSYAYYKAHESEVKKHMKFYLNLDMPNVNLERANTVWIGVNNEDYIDEFEFCVEKVVKGRPEYAKYEISVEYHEMSFGSDQATFGMEGKDVSSLFGSGSVGYHTKYDTIEQIYPESLALAGEIYGTFALNFAGNYGRR